jgi:hypothetical protein
MSGERMEKSRVMPRYAAHNDEMGAPVEAFSEWHHIAREMPLTQGTFGQEDDMAQAAEKLGATATGEFERLGRREGPKMDDVARRIVEKFG